MLVVYENFINCKPFLIAIEYENATIELFMQFTCKEIR